MATTSPYRAGQAAELAQASGLGWVLLARALSCSPRALHRWDADGTLPGQHRRRLAVVAEVVAAHAHPDPEVVRQRLLARHGGPSAYGRLLGELARDQPTCQPAAWVDRQPFEG